MTDSTAELMFERDPDQTNVPDGHTAYTLRHWGRVYEGGSITKVGVWGNALPSLTVNFGMTERDSHFPKEVSRVFVRNDAEIAPQVFTLIARPYRLSKYIP